MIEHYLWLTPVMALAVLLFFRFVACASFSGEVGPPGDNRRFDFTFGNPYATEVLSDKPAGYWRLQAVGLVAHAAATSSGGPAAATTAAVDTSGANLLVLSVADFNHDSTTDTVSDSFGNAWHHIGNSVLPGGSANLTIWYAWDHAGAPLGVGPGHTVTVSGNFCSVELTAWTGIKSDADPLDRQSIGALSGTSAQPGSVTPSADGSLVITAAGFRATGTYSVDSGYSITDQKNYNNGVSMGSAQAFLTQSPVAGTNPKWSIGGPATDIVCAIVSFTPRPNPSNHQAKNEVAGQPDGALIKVATPLPAGDPGWHSNPVTTAVLDVAVLGPPPINSRDKTVTSFRLNGGYIKIPFNADLNPAEFTLEMLVIPEWSLAAPDGNYYCVLESSSPGTSPAPPAPPTQKNQGFAIYAGPPNDPNDPPGAPSIWQLWIGDGTKFQRLPLKNPLPAGDGGLTVVAEPTYLAVTYRDNEVFFFMYHPSKDLSDLLKYELKYVKYTPVPGGEDLLIGITGPRRALFPPFPGPTPGPAGFLYPFKGRIAEVAIYPEAKREERIASHVSAAT